MTGNDDDFPGSAVFQRIENLESAAIGKHEIEQQNIRRSFVKQLASGCQRIGRNHLMVVQAQELRHAAGEACFVINNLYVSHEFPMKIVGGPGLEVRHAYRCYVGSQCLLAAHKRRQPLRNIRKNKTKRQNLPIS